MCQDKDSRQARIEAQLEAGHDFGQHLRQRTKPQLSDREIVRLGMKPIGKGCTCCRGWHGLIRSFDPREADRYDWLARKGPLPLAPESTPPVNQHGSKDGR